MARKNKYDSSYQIYKVGNIIRTTKKQKAYS